MIRGANTYDCFVRDWWRRPGPGEAGTRVPYPGAPKRYIARGVDEDEARAICRDYNETHAPTWRSRKAEYEAA